MRKRKQKPKPKRRPQARIDSDPAKVAVEAIAEAMEEVLRALDRTNVMLERIHDRLHEMRRNP